MASITDAILQENEALFSRLGPNPFTDSLNENSTTHETAESRIVEPRDWLNDGVIDGIDLFAATIRPPVVVTSLPALPDALYPQGSFAFLTTDQKLYRNTTGSAWSAAVASSDITGHVGIPIAASAPALPDSTYPAGSYYWNSVSLALFKTTNGTTWIKAIEAVDIVANSITAGQILAGTITATEIAALTITGAKIAAGTISADKIIANAITAGQIAAGTITATELAALSVTAAKLNILDAAGATVLTGAGFAGSWLDFVASRFYNGHFGSGTTNNITAATIVGTASTEADYIASQSADIPLWVVGAESGAGTLKRVVDSTAVGGYALQWDGTEDATVFQDIPVIPGQRYYPYMSWRYTNSASEFSREIQGQYRKFDHSAIGSELDQGIAFTTTQAAYATEALGEVNVAPADARFLRVGIHISRTSGSPTVWINEVGATAENHYGNLKVHGKVSMDSNQDVFMYRAGTKHLKFDTDGNGTALTKVSIPGALEVHGGTSFPASPATNDLFYRTDLQGWYFWNGTRWLSQTLYSDVIGSILPLPLTGTTTSHRMAFPMSLAGAGYPGADGIWIEYAWLSFYVLGGASALGASHKWVVTFTNEVASVFATTNIDSGASAVWRGTGGILVAAVKANTNLEIEVTCTKTGTPGNLYAVPRITYRLIAT